MNVDPTVVAAVSSAFSSIVLFVSIIILLMQVREMRRATYAQAFKAVYDILQTDDVRAARGTVLGKLRDKPFEDWNEVEIKAAEKVCQTFDSAAIMVRHGMIPVEAVADSWGDSLRRTWKIIVPLVTSHRIKRNSSEFWDDYEWLARQAEHYQKTVHSAK